MLAIQPNLEQSLIDIDNQASSFDHPWQAEAFGLIVQLHKNGRFEWTDWVRVFSAEIKAHPQRPDETANDAYYRQWLAALETITSALISPNEVTQRIQEWRQAYLNTPHGEPVSLANALCPPKHHHIDGTSSRGPVKVVPAVLSDT